MLALSSFPCPTTPPKRIRDLPQGFCLLPRPRITLGNLQGPTGAHCLTPNPQPSGYYCCLTRNRHFPQYNKFVAFLRIRITALEGSKYKLESRTTSDQVLFTLPFQLLTISEIIDLLSPKNEPQSQLSPPATPKFTSALDHVII